MWQNMFVSEKWCVLSTKETKKWKYDGMRFCMRSPKSGAFTGFPSIIF
jgi:hypothetical protein